MSEAYVILEADDLAQLADYVNKAITQGYDPVGGVGCHKGRDGYQFFQALTDKISIEVSQIQRPEIHGSRTGLLTSAELKSRLANTDEGIYVELEDQHFCPVFEVQLLSDPHRTVLRVDPRPVSFTDPKYPAYNREIANAAIHQCTAIHFDQDNKEQRCMLNYKHDYESHVDKYGLHFFAS